jgi:hypothetical protein|tara:strand:- start:594 stop:782 length:189 start_codon:yes stop_codon:yes gene_type:complete
MKKLILFLFILTSCSFNSDSAYWNENLYTNYEELDYDKNYTFDEYGKILDQYSDRKEFPDLN